MDNPFGDEHLLDTFVWAKKLDKEGKKDLSNEEIQQMHRSKMIKNKVCVYLNVISGIRNIEQERFQLFF